MRRVVVLLSALVFALAMSGDAFAKDAKEKKPKLTEAEKANVKEQTDEKKQQRADAANKGAPLMRLHVAHGKPDSNWLHEKDHNKGP